MSTWIQHTQDYLQRFFAQDGTIELNQYSPALFEEFLLARFNNSAASSQSLNSGRIRSALKHLDRLKRLPLPVEYSDALSTLLSDLSRIEADQLQAGTLTRRGKAPFPFFLCDVLSQITLTLDDGGFTHLFLTTQRNLISVETLHTSHIIHADDSITCVLHKNEPRGTRTKNPRHVYVNPFCPSRCWITALAINMVCNPRHRQGPFFP